MTRRTKLSATFLSALLLIAAIGAVAVPVSAGGSDETDNGSNGGMNAENACDYTVTIGYANATVEDAAVSGPGLPNAMINERTVVDRDRVIETDGASLTVMLARASLDNVTIQNSSAVDADVGFASLHVRDVAVAGPGLPEAMIDNRSFVVRNQSFAFRGETFTADELRVSVENVTVRDTSDECDAANNGDDGDNGDDHQKQKSGDSDQSDQKQKSDDHNATMAGGHEKSDKKTTQEMTDETTETQTSATTTAADTANDNEESSADAQSGAERTRTNGPGFGIALAIIALLAAALLAVRRS